MYFYENWILYKLQPRNKIGWQQTCGSKKKNPKKKFVISDKYV